MKRTILALLLTTATGISLYACTGDDSAAPGGDDGGQSDGGPTGDGSFSPDGSITGDSGTDGGLNSTSLEILAVKNAAPATPDGGEVPSTVSLPIDHAFVTYVRPAVLPDPAGFFLQAEQTGPAVFVAIDPATLSTPPVPGDDVSMTVTSVGNLVSLHEVLAVTGFKINSHGNSIAGLLRPVSTATDLVSKLDNYESEYIQLDGFVSGNFGGSGGSKSAEIVTAAVSSPNTNLELRIPPAVQTFFDIENTCQFSLTGIMWRFGKGAEPSGWANADLTVTCSAPKVVNAVATSLTTVNVLFDRDIAASSIMADGSQFAITDSSDAGVGATVTAAAAGSDPQTVTLTTLPQTSGQTLEVVVASTIEDVLAKPLDMAHNSADFLGYVTPAVVRFSELSPQITGSHDLVELQVISDGNLIGIMIQENLVSTTPLATLPNLQVVAGDLVIVHLNADLADGGAGSVTDESVSKTDCSVDAGCYDTAWDVKDVLKSTKGLTAGGRVVVVKSPNGQIMDGISWFMSTASSPNVTSAFFPETNALIDAGQWVGCGGTYCVDSDAAAAISVDMRGTGSVPSGKSVQRVISIDSNTAADWQVDAGTLGFENN